MKYFTLITLVFLGLLTLRGYEVNKNHQPTLQQEVAIMQRDCNGNEIKAPLPADCSKDIQTLQSGQYGNIEVLSDSNLGFWAEVK